MSWPTLYYFLNRAAQRTQASSTKDAPGSTASALGNVAGALGAEPSQQVKTWFDEYAEAHTGEPIGDDDWVTAADDLNCEVAAIKAIAAVESGKLGAFGKPGWPIILYERHLFSAATGRKFDTDYPEISGKTAYRWPTQQERASQDDVENVYGWTQEMNYARLEEAYALDKSAALKSASWGRFQILGKNHAAAAFSSVEDYVKASCTSEKAQLKAFVNFLKADAKLLKALQEKNWAGFAEIYNGPQYKTFNYDTRMQTAYERETAAIIG